MTNTALDRTAAPAILGDPQRLEAAGQPAEAMRESWQALDLAPNGAAEKRVVAGLLRNYPDLAPQDRRDDIQRLLGDPHIEPTHLARAGWKLVLTGGEFAGDVSAITTWLERDELALQLLHETYVPSLDAELVLTQVRRELLLSERWPDFPRLTAALIAQAAHNGGAWPFDEEERRRLKARRDHAMVPAYLPRRTHPVHSATFSDSVTALVANQYRGWPFPVWSRVSMPPATTVPTIIDEIDPGGNPALPIGAELLIAGCGTGREAKINASRYPDASITAIDISDVSLAYAAERCAEANVEFHLLDLHRVAELGRKFDLIICSGVLHHLPDPEAGWAALVDALKPGGVMRVMVYSRIARLNIRGAQARIADLLDVPVDDELLRVARLRLIEKGARLVSNSFDFYTLGGVHDLLMHRHEDPFDVPRIARAIERLGLQLLRFVLPTPASRANYLRDHPHDPLFRDYGAWAALEKRNPFLFSGMYEFWCRKRVA